MGFLKSKRCELMKVLVVDNGSRYLEHIVHIVGRKHLYDVVKYDPQGPMDDTGYDAIVLSGGMKNEVVDELPDGSPYFYHEFELIRNTGLPVMGICLGLQMVNVALGGTLQRLPEFILVYDHPVALTVHGQSLLGTDTIGVHKRHQWAADDIEGTGLHVIAESDDCIEMLYHPERNIVLTQFHPEHDIDDDSLFWNIFDTVTQGSKEEQYPMQTIAKYA